MALGRKSIWTPEFSKNVQQSLTASLVEDKICIATLVSTIKNQLKAIFDYHQPVRSQPHPLLSQNVGLGMLLDATQALDGTLGGFSNLLNPLDKDAKKFKIALEKGVGEGMSVDWMALDIPKEIKQVEELSLLHISSVATEALPIIRGEAERDLFIVVRICSEFILADKMKFTSRSLRALTGLFPKAVWRGMFTSALNLRIKEYEQNVETKMSPPSLAAGGMFAFLPTPSSSPLTASEETKIRSLDQMRTELTPITHTKADSITNTDQTVTDASCQLTSFKYL